MDTFEWPRWSAPIRADRPSSSISVATVLRKLCSDLGNAELVARVARLLAEVVRVAQRSCGGRKDHRLLPKVGEGAATPQHLDREPGKRHRAAAGCRLDLVDALEAFAGYSHDFSSPPRIVRAES